MLIYVHQSQSNKRRNRGEKKKGKAKHTETMRAEVARANPATLAASAHLWAKSWREQVSLAPLDSNPKALEMDCVDLRCKVVELRPVMSPTLVGCMRVAAVCSEAAIATKMCFFFPSLCFLFWLQLAISFSFFFLVLADNRQSTIFWWLWC